MCSIFSRLQHEKCVQNMFSIGNTMQKILKSQRNHFEHLLYIGTSQHSKGIVNRFSMFFECFSGKNLAILPVESFLSSAYFIRHLKFRYSSDLHVPSLCSSYKMHLPRCLSFEWFSGHCTGSLKGEKREGEIERGDIRYGSYEFEIHHSCCHNY
jgi:hypothetical protein